jgi:hypothetical protein
MFSYGNSFWIEVHHGFFSTKELPGLTMSSYYLRQAMELFVIRREKYTIGPVKKV